MATERDDVKGPWTMRLHAEWEKADPKTAQHWLFLTAFVGLIRFGVALFVLLGLREMFYPTFSLWLVWPLAFFLNKVRAKLFPDRLPEDAQFKIIELRVKEHLAETAKRNQP